MHAESSSPPPLVVDRLTGLLDRFQVRASVIDGAPLRFARWYGEEAARAPVGHLHVVRSGTVEVVHRCNDAAAVRRIVEGPALVLYPSQTPHQLVPVDRPDVTCAALEFAYGARHPLVRALPTAIIVATAEIDGLEPALAMLVAEMTRVRCGQRLVADRLLEVILIQLLRWLFDHPGEIGVDAGLLVGMADPQVAPVLAAVHSDPGAPWTLETMARRADLSRSAFAARFRERVGQTPAAYVADFRIAIAQSRLVAGEHVASIASDLGYANASGLSRVFTARTGASPRAWLSGARVAGAVR